MSTVLKVEHLSKSYNGLLAVNDLSFEVNKGEIFGLLGANGAGKSTSIECILGTKKADTGNISILDMNPITQRKKLFEYIGVQFQENNYQDNITVSELCEETQSLYKSSTDYQKLLELFNISDKVKSSIDKLSGGQKQKLFIVLALIPKPQIIFLDELTTGLDTKARREVWKCFTKLKNEGLTVFLISHFMDEVEQLCDRIGILKNGSMVFYGTVQDAISVSPYENLEDAYLWYTDEEEKEESNNESI